MKDRKIQNVIDKLDEKFFTDCGFTNIEQLSIAYNDYKSKCEKALKKLKEIRQSTFTKYNSNEWDNCLSYNDDIKPLENILNGSDEDDSKS